MLRKTKSSSAINKGTPQTSRKVYVFSKWLTQGDQIELVQKDMESAKRFRVQRHKLSGLEKEEGSLVVGVTALTFVNLQDQICFVHPYQIIGQYLKNDNGQLEYCLSSKYKNVRYLFDVGNGADAADMVAEIDRRSLRLEKSIANGGAMTSSKGDGSKSPRGDGSKSPRSGGGGVPMFDADLDAQKPRQKVTQVAGSRFRVRMIMEDGLEHKAVAIVSKESITLVDPTLSTGDNPNSVHYRSCKWAGITAITSSKDEVKIVSRDGVTIVVIVQDAHAFIEEINRKRDEGDAEKRAAAAAAGGGAPAGGAAAADDGDDEDCEVLKW